MAAPSGQADIQNAVENFKARLSPSDWTRVKQTKSIDTLVERLQSNARPSLSQDTAKSRLNAIESSLKRLRTMLLVFLPAVPEVSIVVYGTFDLMYERSDGFNETQELVLEMIQSYCEAVPSFHTWEIVFAEYPQMQNALVDYYNASLDFLSQVISDFEKPTKGVQRFKMTKAPLKLQTKLKDLKQYTRSIEKLLVPATVGLHHQWQVEIREKLKNIEINQPIKLPCHALPMSSNPHFHGRREALSELSFELKAPSLDQKSIAVHGIGGVGKTQVALKFVYDHLEMFAAVFWINADSTTKLQQSYVNAAKRLGLVAGDSEADADAVVADLKHWALNTNERWLMVFDNADDITLLDSYWPPGRTGVVLITSRDPNSKAMTSSAFQLHVMDTNEAVSMLLGLLEDEIDHLDPAESESEAQEIARMIGNLPLAIHQAASYISENGCSLTDFIAEFQLREHKTDPFASVSVTTPNRFYTHSLSTVWSMSLQTLQSQAAYLLRICSLFDPDEIPEKLLRDGLKLTSKGRTSLEISNYNLAIKQLLRNGLVQRITMQAYHVTEDSVKSVKGLTVHRLLQDVAFSIQEEEQRLASFEQAGNILMSVFPRLQPSKWRLIEHWPECDLYIAHVISFHAHAEKYQAELPEGFEEVLFNAGWYLFERKSRTESFRLFKSAERLCESRKVLGDIRYRIMTGLGAIYVDSSTFDYKKGEEYFGAVWDYRESSEPRDEAAVAYAIDDVANCLTGLGRYKEALALHERAISAVNKIPDAASRNDITFHINHNTAKTFEMMGLPAQALEKHLHFGDVHGGGLRKANSPQGAINLYAAGNAYLMLKDESQRERGIECHIEAFEIRRKILGDHVLTAVSLRKLGCVLLESGASEDARASLQQSCEMLKKLPGADNELVLSLYYLSQCEVMLGEAAAATAATLEACQKLTSLIGFTGGPEELTEELCRKQVNYIHY